MEYSFYDFLKLLGSLALFLYGMKIMSEGLQKFAIGKQFADSFIKYETKAAYVCPQAGWVAYIEEFYIFIIIYPEIQSFGPIINFRTDNLIGKIKIKTVINIQKWTPDGEFFRNIIIFATNL